LERSALNYQSSIGVPLQISFREFGEVNRERYRALLFNPKALERGIALLDRKEQY
jgi:hypothetical protein